MGCDGRDKMIAGRRMLRTLGVMRCGVGGREGEKEIKTDSVARMMMADLRGV